MKYFYIIERDGMIHELPYLEEKYQNLLKILSQKGMIITVDKNGEEFLINSVDVSKVLLEEKYDEYTRTMRGSKYIKNGTWYDTKERKMISHQTWKQREIENKLQIQSSKQLPEFVENTKGARERISNMLKEKGLLK